MPQNHLVQDTIVAIATPLGEGGLGVVRLSGPAALNISASLFSSPQSLLDSPTHTLHHGWITFKEKKIDETVAAVFRAPRSYTGENVVEFSCHGSPAVLQSIVELAQQSGARLARPGEFTERAFLNGKMDLVQAEAVSDLIHAKSQLAQKAAAQQLEGVLSQRIQNIRKPLLELLAQMEANLDFAEEGIAAIDSEQLNHQLMILQKNLHNLLEGSLKGRRIRDGVRVAILGRPNVGKSSLFNAFLAQNRAIVTPIPGTTRDYLEEEVQWNSLGIVLIDTAGLRETSDSVELIGHARALQAAERADLCLLVLDASQATNPEDLSILASIQHKKIVLVGNKMDLGIHGDYKSEDHRLHGYPLNYVSAATGSGLTELRKTCLDEFEFRNEAVNVPLLTNLRHIHEVEMALKSLQTAQTALTDGLTEETVGTDLKAALQHISSITGENVTDDVIETIFRRFCIGK